MPKLTRELLKEVVDYRGFPAVSIYLPTIQFGPDVFQNPVRLKNKIKDVKEQLTGLNVEKKLISVLSDRLEVYLNDLDFWQHQLTTLALFVGEDVYYDFQLPFETTELLHINNRFVIKPLLEQFSENMFYILAISQESVRLLKCTAFECNELELPAGISTNLKDAVGESQFTKEIQSHVLSGGQAVFHGHGQEIQNAKQHDVAMFVKQVSDGVINTFQLEKTPLIVVADDAVQTAFTKVAAASYKKLIKPGVLQSPEHLSVKELHALAWPKVKPALDEHVQAVINEYTEGVGKNRASSDLKEVLMAAQQGRVRILLVAKGKEIWGMFDPESGEIQIKDGHDVQTDDLLDIATLKVLQTDGEVYLLGSEELPEGKDLVAVYRY